MSKSEYLKQIDKCTIDKGRVSAVEKEYKVTLGDLQKKIISLADQIDFFDEERRALSFAEILKSKKMLGFDFCDKGLLPIVDAYDNTYIIYMFKEEKWAKINIVDGVIFKKKTTLKDVL